MYMHYAHTCTQDCALGRRLYADSYHVSDWDTSNGIFQVTARTFFWPWPGGGWRLTEKGRQIQHHGISDSILV